MLVCRRLTRHRWRLLTLIIKTGRDMPSILEGHVRQDAPTRQAETVNHHADDGFEKDIYHIEASDTFLTIDYLSRPTIGQLVATVWLDTDTVAIERYNGQKSYIGVVVVLELYKPLQLDQWIPRFHPLLQLLTLTPILNMISMFVLGSEV